MMKATWKNMLRNATLVAMMIGFLPELSEAQILKRITNRVGEKIEREAARRADRKVDQAINKGFDKVEEGLEGNNQKDGNKADAQKDMASRMETLMGGLSADVTLKDSYDFKLGITYDVTTSEHEASNEQPTVMSMWFSDGPYIGNEMSQGNVQMTSVVDDGQIIMFNDEDKSYMAISSQTLGAFSKAAQDAGADVTLGEEDQSPATMKRLGDENILGYNCKVYEFSTAEATTKVWYTEQLNVNMFEAFIGSIGALSNYTTSDLPKEAMDFSGVMMKMESLDKASGDRMKMEAKQVNKEGKTIKSSDYKRMGMN